MSQQLAALLEWIQRIGPAGAVVFGAAFVPAAVLFVPGALFSLGAGFVFGLPLGVAVMSVSSTLGAAAAFVIARTLARDRVASRIARTPKLAAIGRAVEADAFRIVVLTRLSPLFPYNLLNYAYGVTRVPFRTFVVASWIGMLPGTLMYVYLGTAAKSVASLLAEGAPPSPERQSLLLFGLAATVAVTVLVTRSASRALDDVL